MAITAAIALSSATCKVGQSVTALLTVTNGNAEAVQVVECTPLAFPSGRKTPAPIGLGLPPIAPGQTVNVPAGGTLVLRWGVTPLAPVPRAPAYDSDGAVSNSASQVYDVGAELKTSDGTNPSVSTTTLTASTP